MMGKILSDEEVFGGQPGGGIMSDEAVFGAAPQLGPKPAPIGLAAQGDFLRRELAGTDWGTRNIAGFGTALSNVWEGAKQFVGKGDRQAIEANKIIEEAAPVGAIAGNVAMTAIPFGIAGNSAKAATAIGGTMGALKPIEGEQTFENIARGKTKAALLDAALAGFGQAAANKFGGYVSSKMEELALKKAQNAPIDKTLNDALDAGLKVTPTAAQPTAWNAARESIGGKIATGQQVSNENAKVIDSLARKAVGLAEDAPLTSEAMRGVRAQAYKDGYEPIAQLGTMKTDKQFVQALDSLVAKHQGAAQSFPGAFKDEVPKAIAALKVGEFDAGNALKATQLLREEAQTAFRAGDTGLYQAKKGAAKAIEEQIARNLSAGGQDGAALLKNFQNARTRMAKAHTVEDAIVEGGGTLDARKLGSRVQAGKFLDGELGVIGNFANNFKQSVQPAAKIQGPGVSALKPALSLMAGSGGAMMGGPVGAAIGAAAPFVVPPAMRAQMLSKGSQNALRKLYQLGLPTRAANRLLQYAPVAGTVLGSETLSK